MSSVKAAGVASGKGAGSAAGMLSGARGEVFVGALLMISVMRIGTVAGVTFSIIVKAGSNKTVVGSE